MMTDQLTKVSKCWKLVGVEVFRVDHLVGWERFTRQSRVDIASLLFLLCVDAGTNFWRTRARLLFVLNAASGITVQ